MHTYNLTRSDRKTISISIAQDLTVMVKAPLKMPVKDIELFISKHSSWIEKHKALTAQRNEYRRENALSQEQIKQLKIKARETLHDRVKHFSSIMNVRPAKVKITSAVTRWGSCSGKNSLSFSFRNMLLPQDLIDYIVVHELAHIRVKNHSHVFYDEIAKYMPDYKERIAKLKEIQKKLPL